MTTAKAPIPAAAESRFQNMLKDVIEGARELAKVAPIPVESGVELSPGTASMEHVWVVWKMWKRAHKNELPPGMGAGFSPFCGKFQAVRDGVQTMPGGQDDVALYVVKPMGEAKTLDDVGFPGGPGESACCCPTGPPGAVGPPGVMDITQEDPTDAAADFLVKTWGQEFGHLTGTNKDS